MLEGMRISARAVSATFLLMAVTIGYACCMAYGAHPVALVDEKAIIIWNAEQKREHFIRQASFDSEAEHFGFIVPVPSHPEVAEADAAAFNLLESLIPMDPEADGDEDDATESTDDDPEGVDVIEQYVVGDYEVTILTATDGKSMLAWLEENEYDSRPAMEEWLDYYAKKDWFFAALKFIRAPDTTDPKTEALRISFDTDAPFYPYKMPTDTWPSPHYRPLALYFIASGKTSAQYQDNSVEWEAEVLWSGRLPGETQERLEEQLGLAATDFPSNAIVTVFHNNRTERGYDSDLAFQVFKPLLPTWASFAFLAVIVAVVIIVARRRSKANA